MSRTVDPRLRALYLLAIAIGVFFLPVWWMAAAVLALQATLWLGLGLGGRALLRQLRKLALLCTVLLVCYAVVGEDPELDRWRTIHLLGFGIDLNTYGAMIGLKMVLRIIAVVLASQVARAGDTRALAHGLGRIGLPRTAALAIDAVLAFLGESGRGGVPHGGTRGSRGIESSAGPLGRGGGGGGGGGGRGRGRSKDLASGEKRGLVATLRQLAGGDVRKVVAKLRAHVARVEQHIAESDGGKSDRAYLRDVAVIAGIALTMLGFKSLKILPGLPFAPGYKGVVLIPLYVVAGLMTRARLGATLTGLTMGTVAFLLGDGRYGVFEIAKHVAPGLVVDLGLPFMRAREHRRGRLAWCLFGLVVGLGRFATIAVIAVAVQAPGLLYTILLPGLAIHSFFGVLSGIVTAPLLRALAESEAADAVTTPSPPAEPTDPSASPVDPPAEPPAAGAA